MPAQRSNRKYQNSCPSMLCAEEKDDLLASCAATTSQYFGDLAVTATSQTFVGPDGNMQAESQRLEVQPPSLVSSSKESDSRFPVKPELRDAYRTKDGKKLTAHQWAVYDFILNIPTGKVTTYKDVALAAGGSPRSVGSALKNNPFSPYVPCHRVIASNLFVGGFFGEWGKDHKTGTKYNEKLEILSQEGVRFNDKGQLISKDNDLWHP